MSRLKLAVTPEESTIHFAGTMERDSKSMPAGGGVRKWEENPLKKRVR